jgi:hypothetical protein
VPKEIYDTLVPGEVAHVALKTFRDVAVFTNLRLIVRDSQGITGKKVEQYSLPWDAVNMWSSENAGHLDLDSEIELWTRAGHVKIEMKRDVDVRKIDNLIAAHVLGISTTTSPQSQQVRQTQQTPAPAAQRQPQQEPRGGMLGNINPFKR